MDKFENLQYLTGPIRLSVPLSSGRWLQRYRADPTLLPGAAFSPLVIGAMAATTITSFLLPILDLAFSPLVIGAMAATDDRRSRRREGKAFSPLVIGAMAATGRSERQIPEAEKLSVPLSSGRWLQLLLRFLRLFLYV